MNLIAIPSEARVFLSDSADLTTRAPVVPVSAVALVLLCGAATKGEEGGCFPEMTSEEAPSARGQVTPGVTSHRSRGGGPGVKSKKSISHM